MTVCRSDKGKSSTVFSSCSSTQHPVILSGQSNNLWVESKSGHKSVSQGFQLTVLSVQRMETKLYGHDLVSRLKESKLFLKSSVRLQYFFNFQRSLVTWWTQSSTPGIFPHSTLTTLVQETCHRKTRSCCLVSCCCSILHIRHSLCSTRTLSNQILGKY